MYFRDPEKELPIVGQLVLIKLDCDFYYVCKVKPAESYFYSGVDEDDKIMFIEASGEFYKHWALKQVLGWMPLSELSSIEIK